MNPFTRRKYELDKLWALRISQKDGSLGGTDVEQLPEYFCHYPHLAEN
jgi:hypothetical protein